jgi:hypothetical protein
MSHARRVLVALVTSLTIAGCSLDEPVPPAPAPPTIEVVGILADYRIAVADGTRTVVLEDGRTFELSTDVTWALFAGGLGHPFVIGHDATGQFMAGFASQEGRAADCHIVPAGGGQGIERGAFIEAEGILWRKSPDFRSEVAMPALGQRYTGVGAFCFNQRAEVFAAVP